MKKYVYNIYSGGYYTPVFECKITLHCYLGYLVCCYGTKNRPNAFMYFVKVVDDDE